MNSKIFFYFQNQYAKFLLYFISTLILISCATKPINLSISKQNIKEYYSSGKYDEELSIAIDKALKNFEEIEVKNNYAVIFDVDETALSNFQYVIKYDFGYDKESWNKWVISEKAEAIPQVKKLYDYLIDRNLKIIFLTGRTLNHYQATYNNLINEGYNIFDTLICKTEDEKKISNHNFKNEKRKILTLSGYKIIGTVGDQETDLTGENTGLKIKTMTQTREISLK